MWSPLWLATCLPPNQQLYHIGKGTIGIEDVYISLPYLLFIFFSF